MFDDTWQFVFHNKIGRCWFLIAIPTILAFLWGIIKSEDVPYINYFLCLTFWLFAIYTFYSYDRKIKIKMITLAILPIALIAFDEHSRTFSEAKIEEDVHKVYQKILQYVAENSNTFSDPPTSDYRQKSRVSNALPEKEDKRIANRMSIIIKKGNDITGLY